MLVEGNVQLVDIRSFVWEKVKDTSVFTEVRHTWHLKTLVGYDKEGNWRDKYLIRMPNGKEIHVINIPYMKDWESAESLEKSWEED